MDDLEDIGDLEKYVNESGGMLLFLSRGYFHSRNCLREVVATLDQKKAFVLVHEKDSACGGCPFGLFFRTTPQDLIDSKLYGPVAIDWHPGLYRDVSMALRAGALGGRKRWEGCVEPTARACVGMRKWGGAIMRGGRGKRSDEHDGTEFREWYRSKSGLTIVRDDETQVEHEEGRAASEDHGGVHGIGLQAEVKSSKV